MLADNCSFKSRIPPVATVNQIAGKAGRAPADRNKKIKVITDKF